MSAEQREKISTKLRGRKKTAVHRERISRGVSNVWGDSVLRENMAKAVKNRAKKNS